MDFKGFMQEMADLLEVEVEELSDDFELNKENFESIMVVSTIALIDECFDITVTGKALAQATTMGGVLELIKKGKMEL